MMDVKKVAKLARLQLTSEEEERFDKQLSSIVKYFNELEEVDTEGVEPFISPVMNLRSWREDSVKAFAEIESVMEEAPELMGRLFQVPPVV